MSAAVTVAAALDDARHRLRAAGIDAAAREARLLLGHATGLDGAAIMGHPEHCLTPEAARQMGRIVAQRAERRPLAQVVGEREFWSLPFRVTDATLDPRPDSETIVSAVLDSVTDRQATLRILDLGTGTGCLLLALLTELPGATGVGTDISEGAVAVAKDNADRLGLRSRTRFAVTDWDHGLTGRFDFVLCNPPYVATDDIDGLAPEVSRFEPRGALDGGRDGLDAYRALAPVLARRLKADGVAAIEVGAGQIRDVQSVFESAGLPMSACRSDLAGIPRCLTVRVKAELTS